MQQGLCSPGPSPGTRLPRPRLPPGTKVKVELDVEPVDKYGRQLAYLYRLGSAVIAEPRIFMDFPRHPTGGHMLLSLNEQFICKKQSIKCGCHQVSHFWLMDVRGLMFLMRLLLFLRVAVQVTGPTVLECGVGEARRCEALQGGAQRQVRRQVRGTGELVLGMPGDGENGDVDHDRHPHPAGTIVDADSMGSLVGWDMGIQNLAAPRLMGGIWDPLQRYRGGVRCNDSPSLGSAICK